MIAWTTTNHRHTNYIFFELKNLLKLSSIFSIQVNLIKKILLTRSCFSFELSKTGSGLFSISEIKSMPMSACESTPLKNTTQTSTNKLEMDRTKRILPIEVEFKLTFDWTNRFTLNDDLSRWDNLYWLRTNGIFSRLGFLK